MRNTITYAGVNSASVGLVVEKYPSMNRPARKFDKVSVKGRNGDIYFMQDAFSNVEQEYEIWCPKGQFSDVLNFLYPEERGTTVEDILRLEVNGYKQLQDSYDPNVTRLACVTNGFDVENLRNRYARATITFDCRPERFTADAFDWINLENETPVAESKEPYFLKSSPSADIEVDEIVGGSVGWNQLAYFANGTYSSNGVTAIISNGFLTLSGTATADVAITSTKTATGAGHILFVRGGAPNGSTSTYWFRDGYDGTPAHWNIGGENLYKKVSANANIVGQIQIKSGVNTDGLVFKPQIYDLTLALGSTIADYVYSLETATAGAGVTWLKEHFPKMFGQYNAYDSGSIKSVEGVSAHKMVGFNQWDEEWRNGYYQTANGAYTANANYICSKNMIPVLPSTTYYMNTNGNQWEIYEYDADGNYLRQLRSAIVDSTFVTDADTHYINIGSHGQMTTYNNDICINISDTAKNGTYEPYKSWSYSLDSSLTLRGIPKLDSSNNLYYDGDTYASDGTVTRKYGIVDLGTLTWTYNDTWGTVPVFTTQYDGFKTFDSNSKLMCAKYPQTVGSNTSNSTAVAFMTDKQIQIKWNSTQIYISDSAYTDAASFKTAMSGVYLVYELATPTTESATSFINPQTVGTTEEYVSTGIVPVGHNSKYYDNPLTNPSPRNARPCLKVYGSGAGTVVCNGYVINISNIPDYIYIDSDSQNCFKEISDANLNNLVTLTSGFPVLSAGGNSISWSGGVTNVEVMPRWWSL